MPSLRRRVLFLLLALVATLASRLAAQSNNFTTVVVFGDSLSDTGNIANLVEHANPLGIRYPAYDATLGFNYTDGRFTDGTDTQPAAKAYLGVWIEQLAASFPAKPAVKDSLDGGTNYAYGDATTATGTTTESRTVGPVTVSISLHNMGQQVTDYLGTNPTPNAQTLYVLWGGADDLYGAVALGQDPVAAAPLAAANILGLVRQLVAAGGTQFMIPNLPPLGGVPDFAGGGSATALNTASAAFAVALAQGLAAEKIAAAAQGVTLTIYQPDILTLYSTVATNPMAVALGNVTSAAQGISGSPDPYLIWDGLHPTTTGHHLAAASAANLLVPLAASSTSLSVPAVTLDGQAVTLTATVSPGSGSTKPTGLVTFFQGSSAVASAALDGTGTGTATLTGSAAASPYSLIAVYGGDTTYNVSASAAQPLTVLSGAVGTTTALSSSNANADLNASITFTATVAPTVSTYGTPAGTVTFLDGTTTLGTGTLSNGVATYTTTSLAAGTHSITASYAANGIFGGSVSSAVNQVITAPSFTAQATPTSLSISSGSSSTASLSAQTAGGFTGTITLACGMLPAHFSCSFSSTSLTIDANTNMVPTSTLTIATNASAALAMPDRPGGWSAPRVFNAALFLPGVALFGWGLRRRRGAAARLRLWVMLLVMAVGATFGLAGCGSSNNAARGTYTVPVTFTPSSSSSTTTAQTVNITVTVQ